MTTLPYLCNCTTRFVCNCLKTVKSQMAYPGSLEVRNLLQLTISGPLDQRPSTWGWGECCLNDLGTTALYSRKQLWKENDSLFPWQYNSPKEKRGGESIPRQIEKSGVPEKEKGDEGPQEGDGSGALAEETGVWNSQWGGKDKCLLYFYIP